ncbi:MAG: tRNA uridine-5-carboxymethylaminomethyl(34) synthesis enzyme MnmG [Clostridia bacterium]|nr:tRNA uridine-5-carboxymethylaminomethyl(34) synthesis enzyme MnmG [Clostridia bacterium]
MNNFDVIVIGAGHAGCEAALACARTGQKTLCFALHMDSVAFLACNPAVGGTSKGHLVREVDALGGEMGRATDQTLLQSHMLNLRKGPAVHSLRAQVDKQAYAGYMRRVLETQENLTLLQAEAAEILTENGRVCGVVSAYGQTYRARAVVVCTGVYLRSRTITGEYIAQTGPSGLLNSRFLADSLTDLGITLRRFKTGTPPRLDGKTVDYSQFEPQHGDEKIVPFSFMTDPASFDGLQQAVCYLGYTNEATHEILRANLDRSPMFSGVIDGTGARYCPSIEDKVVRFADKPRHQLFIEPEGNYTDEVYVQGFSTSMPFDVQERALHTIKGLENARIVRAGYAIEYDCIDGRCLSLSLMHQDIAGLFFAGQIVGSSGYEEAAAQGLLAGLNASLYLRNQPPLVLSRMQAYLGVLVDDLVTKGTPEPYRMMTARAEYRLLLRQDNADLRLTALAHQAGLADDVRMRRTEQRAAQLEALTAFIDSARLTSEQAQALLPGVENVAGQTLARLLARPEITLTMLKPLAPELAEYPSDVLSLLETEVKYRGYIERQQRDVERQKKAESRVLPPNLDYASMHGLRTEARQKLAAVRPENLGQAARISGVSPADIDVLSVFLTQLERRQALEN